MKSVVLQTVLTVLIGCVISTPLFAASVNDTFFQEQWYLNDIHAIDAWNTTTGSDDVTVAVLDTGFDQDHPDLVSHVWTNTKEIPGDGIDNDGNGFVDDVTGWNFVEDNNKPEPPISATYNEAAISHGTVLAGIIGAQANNGQGISGINWHVKLMNVRILDNMGVGNSQTARKGIEYAVKNGAKIINLSFTGFDDDPQLEQTIRAANAAGVLVVAAVGNTDKGGIDVDQTPIYPACDGHGTPDNGIIGVASIDRTDTKSTFSNYGSTCTDLSAPGEDILSTVYQNDLWAPFVQGYYQDSWSGTSMATPMVSGAAALVLSAHPHLTPAQLKNILRLSADSVHVTGAAAGKMGAGRVNVASALSLAAQLYPPEATGGSLIKFACPTKVSVDDPCKAVYFYAADGKRHAFPNEKVFFTWFHDFTQVKEVSSAFLASIPLGKNVTYHPGTVLVKFQSAPTVYAVEAKGVLRPVISEAIATVLYGATWNRRVDDISDAFFSHYKIGTPITTAEMYSVTAALSSAMSLSDQF